MNNDSKTGILICHCGTNIAGTINVKELVEYFSKKGYVVRDHEHLCTEDGIELIRNVIRRYGLKRLVIAACTPFLHGELFRKVAEEEGINRGYVEIVNIREQCSWPHYGKRRLATLKARDLIEAGVAGVRYARRIGVVKTPVTRKVLVIGGGVSGIMAALLLADMGIDVVLVEKEPFLGGVMAKLDKLFPTLDCAPCILGPLLAQVNNHPKIKILTLSEVIEVAGRPGDFLVKIKKRPRYVDEDKCVSGCTLCIDACPITLPDEYTCRLSMKKAIWRPTPIVVPSAPYVDVNYCIGCLSCYAVCDRNAINFNQKEEIITERVGAIIIATGSKPYSPPNTQLYGYLKYSNVLTSLEYEWLLNAMGPTGGKIVRIDDGRKPKRICFIHCIGSRSEKNHKYCSAICCLNSLKLAVNTKLRYPDIDITIFYTDLRCPGEYGEDLIEKALELGIKFARARISRVEKHGDMLVITYEDVVSGEIVSEEYDIVVLSIGFEPNNDIHGLAKKLGIPITKQGFIQPYHIKLYPADTFVSGIYVSGSCTGPQDITMAVAHAGLAAARAASLLHARELEVEEQSAKINYDKCIRCGMCYIACDFKAVKFEKGRPVIDKISCRGCGACMAWCPVEAIELPWFSVAQLRAKLKALLELDRAESPLVIAFVCRWCGYAALDNAGANKISYPTNIRPIMVPCSVAVPPRLILEAFYMGADGVLVIGCHVQDCHYRTGAGRFKKISLEIKNKLKEIGIDDSRFEFIETSAGEGSKLAEQIRAFIEKIRSLGPIGSEVCRR